ncbi:MAG: ABC transporter permease, partial [Gemmatimonadaceae bacterium]|nr:ABC transporter permease [Gemmatimonadaceae bacterium]
MNAMLWRKLRADRRAMLGLGAVATLLLLAIAAPLVSRWDPTGIALANQLQPPSSAHWLGTDLQGRDVWARLVYGARISLSVGFLSQGISLSIGLSLGLISGFYGKWVDEAVMRLADVTLAFP